MTRIRPVVWGLVGAAVTAQSAGLAYALDWPVFGAASRGTAALGVAAGAALVTAGVVMAWRSPAAPGGLLAMTGISWLVTAWDNPDLPSWVFVLGRTVGPLWPVLLAHVLLRTVGPVTRAERLVLAMAYAMTAGLEGVVATLVFDPGAQGCPACPVNPLLLAEAPVAAAAVNRAVSVAGPIWCLVLAAAVARRLVRSSPAQRRHTLGISIIGLCVLIMVAVDYLAAVGRGLDHVAGPGRSVGVAVLLLAIALATGWPALALELTRRRLAGLVVEATRAPPLGGLSRVLSTIVREPSARLLYPRSDGSPRFIDAAGEPAWPQAVLTPVVRERDTVAYLDHRRPLGTTEENAILPIARLSLDHERLRARRLAQLREMRESRRRIVVAAGRERRRLERDLHDGAQQQLVSLAIALQLTEIRGTGAPVGSGSTPLSRAAEEVTSALAELRDIARGLYPRELADEGLASALETFAESDPTPVEVNLDLPRRVDAEVESAAYFAVADLLTTRAYAPTPRRTVSVRICGSLLRLDLQTGNSTDLSELIDVQDRIGAVGGTVQRVPGGGVRIELPCVP